MDSTSHLDRALRALDCTVEPAGLHAMHLWATLPWAYTVGFSILSFAALSFAIVSQIRDVKTQQVRASISYRKFGICCACANDFNAHGIECAHGYVFSPLHQ